MAGLLAKVIPLALGAAVSPILFAIVVGILSGARTVHRGLVFAAGAVVPLIALALLVLALGSAFSLPDSPTLKAVLDLALGAVLLALGARALLRRPGPARTSDAGDAGDAAESAPGAAAGAAGSGRYFAFGVESMATNFTTIALFVPAVKMIAESGVDAVEKALVVALVVVLAMTTVIVPLALVALAPDSAGRVLGAIRGFFRRHSRAAMIVLGLGFGTLLVVRGIAGL